MARRVLGAAVVAVLVVAALAAPAGAARTGVEAAAADLLGYVPEDQRYACEIVDPSNAGAVGQILADRAASITALLYCEGGTEDVEFLAYASFSTADAMNATYREFVGNAGEQVVRSGDGQCPGERTWSFEGTTAGSVGCYYGTISGGETTPEKAALAWTYDDALILGLANVAAENADVLDPWWEETAGPLRRPDPVAGLVKTPGTSTNRAVRALRSHAPADFRRSCRAIDNGDPARVGTTWYASRLFVRAVVTCAPSAGADRVTYHAVAPAVVDGLFHKYTKYVESGDEDCPGTGTWSLGSGRKQRDVGEYACWLRDDGTAVISWSQRELGIVAVASRGDGDFDRLFAFWNDEGGPV